MKKSEKTDACFEIKSKKRNGDKASYVQNKKENCVKRKRNQDDDDKDDEFVKKGVTKTKGPIGLIPRQPFVEYTHKKLSMRCSPQTFVAMIRKLTDEQVASVREIGYGSILDMKIGTVPTSLGYWLLVNYDSFRNELNVGRHRIKITPELVHEALGIPLGHGKVVEKNKPRKGVNTPTDEFKMQFDKTKIYIGDVLSVMENQGKGGRLFKLNFMVVFHTIVGYITKSTTINQRILINIGDEKEIPKLDWCSYVIECLRNTKDDWKVHEPYNGPLVFLEVLYTHEFQKRHGALIYPIQKPAIKYISTDTLEKMEEHLYENGPLSDNEEEMVEKEDENEEQLKDTDADEVRVVADHERIVGDRQDRNVIIGEESVQELKDKKVDEVRVVAENVRVVGDIEDPDVTIGEASEQEVKDKEVDEVGLVKENEKEVTYKDEEEWVKEMDKRMEIFDKFVAEVSDFVKEGMLNYPTNNEVVERCQNWRKMMNLHGSKDVDTHQGKGKQEKTIDLVVSLRESTQETANGYDGTANDSPTVGDYECKDASSIDNEVEHEFTNVDNQIGGNEERVKEAVLATVSEIGSPSSGQNHELRDANEKQIENFEVKANDEPKDASVGGNEGEHDMTIVERGLIKTVAEVTCGGDITVTEAINDETKDAGVGDKEVGDEAS